MKFKLSHPESVKAKTLLEANKINLLKYKKIFETFSKYGCKPAAVFAYLSVP